ncbi:MAG: NAD(P)H-dependent oxidoreductase subunit E [Deltaproteobacteria bacterium]|nr:NAD(P)H-dependent oxidoreductase subunit E [Deltaproteobacteria bacterium]
MDSRAKVDALIAKHGYDEAAVIAILQDIQEEKRYVPADMLRHLAERLHLSLARLYGIATFYKAFSLKPKGRHVCCVCTGTACHVKGAPTLIDKLEQDLKIRPGSTTPDLRFTLETVNCVGACALAPLVVVDEDHLAKMTVAKLEKGLRSYR